jgi:hypothetical protein
VIIMGDAMKEYEARCKVCGAVYRLDCTEEELREYLSSEGWMCEIGRHVEIGSIGQYLEIIGESDELSPKPEIEPKRLGEYEVSELPRGLDHIGFGMFKDGKGRTWDYRLGPKGERLYSVRE